MEVPEVLRVSGALRSAGHSVSVSASASVSVSVARPLSTSVLGCAQPQRTTMSSGKRRPFSGDEVMGGS